MAHKVGPSQGRLLLRTSRAGLAAQVGHDLLIEVTRWSGVVEVAEDRAASTVRVTADTGSLTVLEGTGGLKPLSDRDRTEIQQTIRELLKTDKYPDAVFACSAVRATPGGGTLEGRLTLLGVDRPVRLDVVELTEGRYRATGQILQSMYGIKPYSAFFGALKLADVVVVEIELGLDNDD
jgi:polyisoprenoid-binding protein YceI